MFNVDKEKEWFKQNLKDAHVHGKKILAKIRNYNGLSEEQKRALEDIIFKYKAWKEFNEKLIGCEEIEIVKRVEKLNEYKSETRNAPFSSQSKFHSSIIEEFLYYLFKDLVNDLVEESTNSNQQKIFLGGVRAYTNLYFAPKDLESFLKRPHMRINVKDQDFTIYRKIQIKADDETEVINVPVVSIECKTYIDKTMLEGSIATAEKIKNGNPYSLYLIVTEWYDVSSSVDPAYSRIDQIYVLRKQKRKVDEETPIQADVVIDLFNFVREHLMRRWSNIDEKLEKEGKVI